MFNNNFSKLPSRIKYSLFILLSLIFIYAISTYFINTAIAKKITETEQVTCGQISFNLLLGNLELTDIEAIQPLKNTDQVKVKSSQINIRGLSYWQYLNHDKIVARQVVFEDLDVGIVTKEKGEVPLPEEAKHRTEQYEEILIKSFEIKNGYLAAKNNQFDTLKVDDFTINIAHLKFFPNIGKDTISWKSIAFEGHNFLIDEQIKNHFASVGYIQLSNNEELTINNAQLTPKRSKENFIKPLTYRKESINAKAEKIFINQFPINDLYFKQQFFTNLIQVDGFDIEVYSDRTKPRCPNCVRKYFYEYLDKTEIAINIDSILVENSRVSYEQLKAINRKKGKLFWTDVDTKIYNISNVVSEKRANTEVEIIAKFMDKGLTKVNFTFPNVTVEEDYTFVGELGGFDLSELNDFLNAANRINIEQGKINQLKFEGRGNLHDASGKVELRYNNLEVRLFKSNGNTRTFLTNLANSLIRKSNTQNSENLRIGKIYAVRNEQQLFLENWIDALKSGLYSTLLPDIMLPEELAIE